MENRESEFAQFIDEWLRNTVHVEHGLIEFFKMLILLGASIIIAMIAWAVTNYFVTQVLGRIVSKSRSKWDDILVENKALKRISQVIPILIINLMIPIIFQDYPTLSPILEKITSVLTIWIIIRVIYAFITAGRIILSSYEKFRDKPLSSYGQLAKILIGFVGAIIMLSIVLGKNPIYLLSALGAVSAVLLLIFKDTILGFVASIQLSLNDMVRLGDWVSVPKYGADGDVVEINLTTIKVINWDKTYTTVPTYFFVSDSFTNWRGMTESGGRRIKRSIRLKQSSVKFCNDQMLERFSKYQLISEYIKNRTEEIKIYNKENNIDSSSLVNGRNMTNIGVFRNYITAYLKNNPKLHKGMTCMVRQLEASETGIPLEIYCFSAEQAWLKYEEIQADIFDHIFAVVEKFELEVFESPSGSDFRAAFLKD